MLSQFRGALLVMTSAGFALGVAVPATVSADESIAWGFVLGDRPGDLLLKSRKGKATPKLLSEAPKDKGPMTQRVTVVSSDGATEQDLEFYQASNPEAHQHDVDALHGCHQYVFYNNQWWLVHC